jgi:polyhydroxyalkanoate synthase
VSAVRYCLRHGLGVHLIEWIPPTSGEECAGLDEYAGHAIAACARKLSSAAGGERPFLMGHSLGGTLAAIFCALERLSAQGLVLLLQTSSKALAISRTTIINKLAESPNTPA